MTFENLVKFPLELPKLGMTGPENFIGKQDEVFQEFQFAYSIQSI